MKKSGDLKRISGEELIDKGSHLIDLSRLFLGDLKVSFPKLKTYFYKMKLEDNCFQIQKIKEEVLLFYIPKLSGKINLFSKFLVLGKLEINGLGKVMEEKLDFTKCQKNVYLKRIYHFKNR